MPQNYMTALCDRTSKSIDKGALKSAPARFQLSKRTAQKPIVSVTRVAPPRCVSSRAGFLAAYRETAGIEAASRRLGAAVLPSSAHRNPSTTPAMGFKP